jgi:uncharacterized short protein YbdD (DUF466 family)
MGMIQGDANTKASKTMTVRSVAKPYFPEMPLLPGEKVLSKKEFIEECLETLQQMKDHPETNVSEEEFFQDLEDS